MSLKFSQSSVHSRGSNGSTDNRGSLNMQDIIEGAKLPLSKILESRVMTGFLRQYADSQYSSESLAFIQAEQDFQQHFHDFEKRGTVEEEVQKLWKIFLDNNSNELQICMTSDEYATIEKLVHGKKYSRNMFHFLLKTCNTTVERDIYPRFLRSPYYEDMVACLKEPVQEAMKEFVSSMTDSLVTKKEGFDFDDKNKRFTLDEVLNDYVLANLFLTWARESPNSTKELEALMLSIVYREKWDSIDGDESDEARARAFALYFTYLHPAASSCIESLSKEIRHHVGSKISYKKPPKDLFAELEQRTRPRVEAGLWKEYTMTEEYATLIQSLKQAHEELSKGNSKGSSSCVVM